MSKLSLFFRPYFQYKWRMILGLLLYIITLLSIVALLSLSGWFLAATALAGSAGLTTFNYLLPAIGIRSSAIIRTTGRYAEYILNHDTTFRILAKLRIFTFNKIFPLFPGTLTNLYKGELLNRILIDINTLDQFYLRLIAPICGAILIIVALWLTLSQFNFLLASILAIINLVSLISLSLIFYHAGKPIGIKLTTLCSEYRSLLVIWLHEQAELAIFGASNIFRHRLSYKENQWQKNQNHQVTLTALSQALMITISGMTCTFILWFGAISIIVPSQFPNALLALFMFAGLASFETLSPVIAAFQHLGHVIASATRIQELIDQQPCVQFPQVSVAIDPPITLEINKISFHYPNENLLVLKNINFQIFPGTKIALLGKTGCGKSTLLQLLTRAYDPIEGSININGHPLTSLTEDTLRKNTSVMTQKIDIFNATLRDNLLLANKEASDTILLEVIYQVGLENLLTLKKLDTWIGEGGRPLSGGEQKRLGIARILLHQAHFLLLDEPTEGLDAKTEKQMSELILHYCKNKTLLLITHRLHALSNMNSILVMENGIIIERGNHHELLKQHGRYYQFWQKI